MSHPVLCAAETMGEALKSVADSNPAFMSTRDKAAALTELARIESRVAELRLRILADASDVAETTAAKDAASWLAHHTRTRFEDARADLALARALDRRYPVLGSALRDGDANLGQARVVARALDNLPAEVPDDIVEQAEAALVEHCTTFGPQELSRLGRRIVDVVAPEIAEASEAKALADLEAAAHRTTRLTLRPLGDGTTRISGLLPDPAATRLATYLHAFTNPRKATEPMPADPFARLPYPRRMGKAFCHLLETIDPKRLPIHAGDATTLIVTIPLASLRADLGVADLLGAEQPITAQQARRLACTAGIIPAVLGAESEVLDLGRSRRLFTRAQRKALLTRDRTCRAEGCDSPGTWAEAHHWEPWSAGGTTDLTNAVLLCSHHHHRAHDPTHHADRLPSGDVRFHRRR